MRRHLRLCTALLALSHLPLAACDRGLTSEDDDFSPPQNIDDLRIRTDDAAADALTLEWSAPAADFSGGDVPSSAYEIYWGEELVTQQNYESMTLVEVPDAPKAPGEAESFRVEGLPQGPELYFAVAAYDGAGNVSFSIDTSQSAVGATAGAACVAGGAPDEVTALSESALIRFQGCESYGGQLVLSDLPGVPGGFTTLQSLASLTTVEDGDWDDLFDTATFAVQGIQTLTSLDELTSLSEVEYLFVGLADTDSSLTDVGLPGLTRVGNAFFSGLPEMTTVRLASLDRVENLLDFDELSAATRIELPAASRIELLYVENNDALTTLSIPNVQHIESLDLIDNPELETLELPETFTMFSVSVSGCPKLDACELVARFEGLLTEDGTDTVYLDIDGMDACP